MTTGTSIGRTLLQTIIVAVVVALFVRTFLLQVFKIPTGSMERNLLVGDHLIVNRFVFAPVCSGTERRWLPMRAVHRGDIVVFKFPEEPARDFVKRVVGLPGETLEVRARRVYVDDHPLDEPFVRLPEPVGGAQAGADERAGSGVREPYGPVIVPAGHLFVMGDNRDDSEDSRYWGFLPEQNVKGRALLVYWSFATEEERPGGRARWWLGDTRWERILTLAR